MHIVKVKDYLIGNGKSLVLICGPCVIESESLALSTAEFLKNLCTRLQIPIIYKSSYDKANRSSVHSFRGPGLDQGLFILEKVKREFDLPIVTDIHTPEEARAAADVCDILQIPAFLCRQTDLLVAAGETNRVVKVKKGQFMAPHDMSNVIEKIVSTGNKNIILTDRGTCFGYNNLVSDMRALPIMRSYGFPVCFDATHSVQLPGGKGVMSGGQREFIPYLAKAAVAAGADCIYIEAHPDPSKALSDSDSQLPLHELEHLLCILKEIYSAVHTYEEAYV